jgi:DNA-3-methyladenine glycosylase
MERLPRSFFEGHSAYVARRLLGKRLVRIIEGKRLSGTIVEVEAYGGSDDPASHAYKGKTVRNEVMFGDAGHSYVYFTYGFHHCLNVVTEPRGTPGAVLIRALEPTEGIALMMKNRGTRRTAEMTNGPGKLTQAMRIDRDLNGEDLVTSRELYLTSGGAKAFAIGQSPRIGIKRGTERRWRFFVQGNAFVSGARLNRVTNTNP